MNVMSVSIFTKSTRSGHCQWSAASFRCNAMQEAHATTKGARELLQLTLKDVETNVRITQLARTKAALVHALDIIMALHQASTLKAALR